MEIIIVKIPTKVPIFRPASITSSVCSPSMDIELTSFAFRPAQMPTIRISR
uniref:Bm13558 n=1 Tax=Brugia malayi TaxID=6279 RepID=A0A1I9G521_BRUMA|nr:Bm13558 [Brugia malayi]